MASVIIQAIKLAPRFFFQAYLKPSKVYEFIKNSKRDNFNFIIFTLFLGGLLLGVALAILHWYFYRDLIQSTLFVIIVAGVFVCSCLGAFAGKSESSFVGGGTIAVGGAGILIALGAFSSLVGGVGIFTGSLSSIMPGLATIGVVVLTLLGLFLLKKPITTFAVPIILVAAVILWLIRYLYIKKKKSNLSNKIKAPFLFLVGWSLILIAGGMSIQLIKDYEMILYPLSFLMGYLFSSSFDFIHETKNNSKKTFSENKHQNPRLTYQKFGKTQKKSLIWGPLVTIILHLFVYINAVPSLNTRFIITAWGFTVMPIFLLHVTDYLFCLPLWFFQRRKILEKYSDSKEIVNSYEKSLLFKHEMLFFQLPGLYKIMASLAKNKEIGVKTGNPRQFKSFEEVKGRRSGVQPQGIADFQP